MNMNTAIWKENKQRRMNLTLDPDQVVEKYENIILKLMDTIEKLQQSQDRVLLNQDK